MEQARENGERVRRPRAGWRRWLPWLALAGATAAGAVFRYELVDYLSPRNFSYFIESCFRFRYAEMRMAGKTPPKLDRPAQWPEGFRYDLMILPLPEKVTAAVYRLRGGGDSYLAARMTIALLSALGVAAFAPLAWVAFRKPALAAVAVLFYAGVFGAFSRSWGNYLQEDFAFPGLLVATAATWYILAAAPGTRRGTLAFAAAAGAAATAWAGSCWHMSQFYVAVIAAAVVAYGVGGKPARAALAGGALWLGLVAAGALNKPLWAKGALWNVSAALTAAPALAYVAAGALRREDRARWFIGGAALLLGAAAVTFGRTPGYNHVYELLAAKIIHFGVRPAPAALSPDARLFWVGPYASPAPVYVWLEFGPVLLLSAFGAVYWVRATARRELAAGGFAVGVGLAFVVLYLLMKRLAIFWAPWAAVLAVAPFVLWRRAGAKKLVVYGLAVAALWGAHVYGVRYAVAGFGWYKRALVRAFRPPVEVAWYYGTERAELMAWLAAARPGALLTDFSLTPPYLYFLERPVVLHPMFEVPEIRRKAMAYAEAAVADEETLYRRCLAWRTTYIIYFAPQVLSHDPGSFYNYVGREPAPGCPAWRMQFAPEELRRFRLVYETYSTRVFEVGAPYDGYRAPAYHPLFDRDRFPAIPPESELLAFYDDVGRAASRYFEGAALQRLGRYDAAAAAFNDALQWHPDYEDANFRLGVCLLQLGRETEGRRELARAVAAHPGDATARAWLAAVPGRRLPPPAAGK